MKKTYYIQWHLSDKCNLRCKHCYIDERRRDLPLAKMKEGISNILRPISNWVDEINICLSGGEPFMYPNLEEIVLYLKKWKKIKKIMFTSNGTIVNKDLFKKIGKHIDNIQISLEGGETINDQIRGKGIYKCVEKNIAIYKSMNCRIAINMTIHKLNYKEIDSVVNFCLRNKVNILAITRLVPVGSEKKLIKMMLSSEQIKNIYKKLYILSKKYQKKLKFSFDRPLWNIVDNNIGAPCSVGMNAIAILSDGTILPCRRLEIPLGNFLTDNFVNVWIDSPILKKLRNKQNIDKCGKCINLEKCGGCRAIAYGKNKKLMGEDPQCFKEI